MKKNKVTTKMLIYVYAILCAIAIWLNFGNGLLDWINIIVTAVMFFIVGMVFLYSYKKLGIIMKITQELKNAIESINQEFVLQKNYLWNYYQQSSDKELFKEGYLAKHYKDYCDEVKRLEEGRDIGYKCDIEDYINQGLIENYLKKNILAMIPGLMTGLGILGTFVGLSIGLQDFTTGTADEILLSITTLMDGIKIAFHTSIFGMIFSLTFNFIYKNILEDCLEQLDAFLDEFRKKVNPDSKNENEKLILDVTNKQSDTVIKAEEKLEKELVAYLSILGDSINELQKSQNKQNELLQELPSKMAFGVVKGVSTSIADIFLPQFEKMDKTLNNFAFSITENQNVALSHMVEKFMQELNKAVENNFVNLSDILNDTCNMQEESNKHMQEVIQKTGEMIADVQEVNIISAKIIEGFTSYIDLIEKLQEVINENFMNVNIQLDANNQMSTKLMGYIENLVEYEQRISETTNTFAQDMSEQVVILEQVSKEISGSSQENLRILAQKAEQYNETLANAAKKQISGIEFISQQIFDECSNTILTISKNATANNTIIADSVKQQIGYVQAICQDISENCEKNLELLSKNADKNNTQFIDSVKEQMKQIVQVSQNVSNEFDRASYALAKTATQLNGSLELSLQEVLKQFDDELSFITENLGRTISRIDNTTKKVPEVVAGAYDGMYKGFKDLNYEIENMKIEMQKITKNIQLDNDSIN